MEKYLGNKTAIVPLIYEFVRQRVPTARSISDLLAGTTNVSRYFAANGFGVIVNDINRFSYVLSQCYLGLASYPSFDGVASGTNGVVEDNIARLLSAAVGDSRSPNDAKARDGLRRCARVLSQLQETADRTERRPGLFTEFYTARGKRSAFKSVRGTEGRRNYFSDANARALDGVMSTIRRWWLAGKLSRPELFLLLTSVLEEVAITANVNGTFHDFNRDRLWPNALQRFTLRVPKARINSGGGQIHNLDAIDAASRCAAHDVCYLDPPYNFRQYTAYYHLLNFIAAYPFLESPRQYLDKVEHVRGQNMRDDFSSNFCYRDKFLHTLKDVIRHVNARHVVLSYYGGRNHWNHWSKVDTPTDEGLRRLRSFFLEGGMFDDVEIVPALRIRKNYQSRVGERKHLVHEHLFYGKLRGSPARRVGRASSQCNSDLGIARHFRTLNVDCTGNQVAPRIAGAVS